MARRLYFSQTAPPITVAVDSSWETAESSRLSLTRVKDGTAAVSYGRSSTNSSGSADVMLFQSISDPLAATTINGTVFAWARTYETNTAADYRSQILVKVVSNDGSTVRGILLAHDTGALSNEWAQGTSVADSRGRGFPRGASSGVSVNPVNVQDGDRIVVEIGYRRHATVSAPYFGYIVVSSDGADIAVSESATSGDPWIEFSDDLVFLDELNTPPEFTVTPSVNYNGYTRTGPANSPITVSFEAEDDEEDGTDELTVEVRTAASGGGTLVATDDYTSGTAGSISIAHNASGINEGSNTLYMRIGDGVAWSDDESFTLLVDRTAPDLGTVDVFPAIVTGGA